MILGHAWGRERFIHIETSGFRFCPTEPYLEKDGKKSGAHRRVVNIQAPVKSYNFLPIPKKDWRRLDLDINQISTLIQDQSGIILLHEMRSFL